MEILTPKDPLLLSGDKVRGVKLRNSGSWSRKAAASEQAFNEDKGCIL